MPDKIKPESAETEAIKIDDLDAVLAAGVKPVEPKPVEEAKPDPIEVEKAAQKAKRDEQIRQNREKIQRNTTFDDVRVDFCLTCNFYEPTLKICRRSPPTIFVSGAVAVSLWPIVKDYDWCGEFSPQTLDSKQPNV